MLRYVVGVKKEDISNKELYERAWVGPIVNLIKNCRLRWAGHVARMCNSRIPRKILFGKVTETGRGRGKSRRDWMDCLEDDLGLILEQKKVAKWYEVAKERPKWRNLLSSLTSCKKQGDLRRWKGKTGKGKPRRGNL